MTTVNLASRASWMPCRLDGFGGMGNPGRGRQRCGRWIDESRREVYLKFTYRCRRNREIFRAGETLHDGDEVRRWTSVRKPPVGTTESTTPSSHEESTHHMVRMNRAYRVLVQKGYTRPHGCLSMLTTYFFWLLVRDPTPSDDRGVGFFLDFEAAPSLFLGRPAFFFSAVFDSSFFCFFAALSVLPPGRTVFPSAFSSRPSSCFLLSPAFFSFSFSSSSSLLPFLPPPPPPPPPDPFALDSTFNSDAFFTTSFPDRSTLTAGLFGSAFFLILLPRLDVMETSPSCFFSATVPPGAPPPQFHETAGRVSC